jgi:exodeoxyribonuclease VII small subunit
LNVARKKTPSSSEAKEVPFEEAFARLEQIVQELEEGQLGLSESLARYEEGVTHLRRCHEALKRAERKIELLTGVNADGEAVTEPFEDPARTLEEKQEARGRRRSRRGKSRGKAEGDPSAKGDDDIDNQRGLF